MKAGRVALPLARFDHVHRHTARRPHVVVVDASRHNEHKRLARLQFRRRLHLLDLERLDRLPKALRADELRVHVVRHFADGGYLADLVGVFGGDHGVSFKTNGSDLRRLRYHGAKLSAISYSCQPLAISEASPGLKAPG